MSGSKRCCCGNAGCTICSTYFTHPIPTSEWCNTVYSVNFPSIQLPALKSKYRYRDFNIVETPFTTPCTNCPQNSVTSYGYYNEGVFETNEWNPPTSAFEPLKKDTDPRDLYTFDIGEGAYISFVQRIIIPDPCCPPSSLGVAIDQGETPRIPRVGGITYSRDAGGFNVTFRACGNGPNPGQQPSYPPSTSVTTASNLGINGAGPFPFTIGVTFSNRNPKISENILYVPIIQTICPFSSTPQQSNLRCYKDYDILQGFGGTSPFRLTCEASDCRCQSLLVFSFKNRFIAKVFSFPGNSSVYPNTPNPTSSVEVLAQSSIVLVYYGCLDDYIFGDTSAPINRTFTLDGGYLEYRGHDSLSFGGLLNPETIRWTSTTNTFPINTQFTQITTNTINQEAITASCSFGIDPCQSTSYNITTYWPQKYLPPSFFAEFGVPNQITVSRV